MGLPGVFAPTDIYFREAVFNGKGAHLKPFIWVELGRLESLEIEESSSETNDDIMFLLISPSELVGCNPIHCNDLLVHDK